MPLLQLANIVVFLCAVCLPAYRVRAHTFQDAPVCCTAPCCRVCDQAALEARPIAQRKPTRHQLTLSSRTHSSTTSSAPTPAHECGVR
jgi:hypothetical protein